MSLSISNITKLAKERAFGEIKTAEPVEEIQPYQSETGNSLRKMASSLKELNLAPYIEEGIRKTLSGEKIEHKTASKRLSFSAGDTPQDSLRALARMLRDTSNNMKTAAYNRGAELVRAQAGISQLKQLLGQ